MRHLTWLLLGVPAFLVWASLAFPGGSTPPSPEPAPPDLQELLRQLGSKSFTERERASKLLRGRKEAVPHLEKLRNHADAEVRQRVQQLLEEYQQAALQAFLRRLKEQKDNAPVDLMIDVMVHHRDSIDDDMWKLMQNLARSIKAKVKLPPRDPSHITWYNID